MLFLLTSCSTHKEASIKLVTNAWIGYSPLFYAKEKGWLKEVNIEILPLVSLGESMMAFRSGGFDGLTGTQFEYQKLNALNSNLVPVIMFNRSNGGDMVMSNVSIKELQETSENIDVYLEVNSVNALVFDDFKKAHQLSQKTFNFINKDQLKIVTYLKQKTANRPTIVVTYTPYNFELVNTGFQIIDSTRDAMNIIVLDALYVNQSVLTHHREDFNKLKIIINNAIHNLKQNPKEYYKVVKPYLENPSYEEFLQSIQGIVWLNETIPPALIKKMNEINFQTRNLL